MRCTIFLICQIYFGRLLCTNLWRKICKWLNDSDKLTGCFLPRPPSVPMKCPEWSCYLRLSRYLKLNECRLITALIWSYDVICLYGPMNRKINPEKNSFLLFSQMIAQSIMWDSFRVHTSLEGEGERRTRHIFEKKKWSVSQFGFLDKTGRFVNVGVKRKSTFWDRCMLLGVALTS